MKMFFMLFLFSVLPLFSAEIVLKDGDLFLAEITSEDAEEIGIQWKSENYLIPKSEIAKIDHQSAGKDQVFPSSEIQLIDGSRIKGVVSSETKDSVTVKTALGFIQLEKTKIKSTESRKLSDVSLDRYKLYDPDKAYTNLGFSGIYQTFPRLNPDSSLSGAGGGVFFIEPQSLQASTGQPSSVSVMQDSVSAG